MIDPRLVPDDFATLMAGLADPGDIATGHHAGRGRRSSAVLVLLGRDSRDVVLTERASTLRSHPGQISFPGGATDEGENPVQTALREAHEEIGLDPGSALVLGELPPLHIPVSSFTVHPVVALWDETSPISALDPDEVAGVHRVQITTLADPEVRVTWQLDEHQRGPGFDLGEIFVWGFTAHLLDVLLRLGGMERPWPRDRVVEIPERFRQGRH